VEKLNKECAALEREYTQLSQSESPLITVEREQTILEADKEKFQSYMTHMQGKLEKIEATIDALRDELAMSESNVEKLYEEKHALIETVDKQELSPADVDRMNAERDQLVASLETTRANLDEVNKMVWQGEITLQKTMDRLERSVQQFNSGLYKLDIAHHLGKFPGLEKEVELYVMATSPEKMVSVDLVKVCKPSCTSYISYYKKQSHAVQEEIYAMQETIDQVSWNLLQKQEQVSVLSSSVDTCNHRYQEQKQYISKQLNSATQEFSNMSRAIEKLKLEMNQMAVASTQKRQKVTAEYEAQRELREAAREKMLSQVVNGLVEVFGFHQHVLNSIESLKKVASVETE
jgi:kinetochore protein NDC80